MPDGHKSEYGEDIEYSADFCPRGCCEAAGGAPERDVDVAHDPAVEAAMPAAPEGLRRIVVAHAADHVFWWVDAVEQSPEAEESPREQQFEPDMVEVEVAEHA